MTLTEVTTTIPPLYWKIFYLLGWKLDHLILLCFLMAAKLIGTQHVLQEHISVRNIYLAITKLNNYVCQGYYHNTSKFVEDIKPFRVKMRSFKFGICLPDVYKLPQCIWSAEQGVEEAMCSRNLLEYFQRNVAVCHLSYIEHVIVSPLCCWLHELNNDLKG